MMARADDAAEEDQDQLEIHCPLGELARHQADSHEQVGTHAGGEELKGLLDPEVHHPPAPKIGDGERLLDPSERDHAEHVEDGDIDRGRPDQMLQPDAARPELPRRLPEHSAGRPQCPEHQQAPHDQPDEEPDLPEPPELDVRQALIAEPEPVAVDIAHDAEPVPNKRTGNDHQRDPEQQIDQNSLAAGLPAAGNRGARNRPAPIHDTPIQMIGD